MLKKVSNVSSLLQVMYCKAPRLKVILEVITTKKALSFQQAMQTQERVQVLFQRHNSLICNYCLSLCI